MVPDQLQVRELFERLMSRREHIAALVDEYGGLSGIVTLEDIVETLLGLESPVEEGLPNLELRNDWKRRQFHRYREAIQTIQSHGITVNGIAPT